jgi:hypothetical protein
MENRVRRFPVCRAALLTAAVFAVAAVSQVGCSSAGSPQSGAGSHDEATGTVGLELTLPGGALLSSVNYTITGPNGAPTVLTSGTASLVNSSTVSLLIGNIPAGTWAIAISGSADGGIGCSGSATFTITARATTQVSVAMRCNLPAADAGAAAISTSLYSCGAANGIAAYPSEVTVGHSVLLTGTGTGPNPGALTYKWSAPSGTFDTPTASSANFTCTAAGTVTVTLTVGDGALPDGGSCDPTLSQVTAAILCD